MVVSTILASLVMSALLMCIIIYWKRNSKYTLWPAYAYLCYYSIMYTAVHVQFMMELYFLCKICVELFDQINRQFLDEVVRDGALDRFVINYQV